MRKLLVFSCCALSFTMLVACENHEDEASSYRSAFDDARIPNWTVDSLPYLTLGGLDEREGYYFDGVRGALALADRVLVSDGGSHEVRIYDSRGELIARSGGAGEGPGEFRSIGPISAVGDTAVAVWDLQLARVTFLDLQGNLLRIVRPALGTARSVRPTFVGALADGTVAFRDAMPDRNLREAAPGERRDSVQILTEDLKGTARHLWIRGSEKWLVQEESSWGTYDVIFGRSAFQTVAGNQLVLAWSDSLELESYSTALSLRTATVLPWQSRSVSEAEIVAARQDRVDKAEAEAELRRASGFIVNGRPLADVMLEFTLSQIGSLPYRMTEPAFADIRGTPQGEVWLAEFVQVGTPTRRWLVLDSTLRPIARLQANADLTVLHISRHGLVALSSDDLGRELIAVYRIREDG